MPRRVCGPRSWIVANGSRRSRLAAVGVDDADLHARERLPAAAPRGPRHVGVGGVAAVRSERLGHAEQCGPCAGSEPAVRAAAGLPDCPAATPTDPLRRVSRVPCQCLGLIGPAAKQRDPLALPAAAGWSRAAVSPSVTRVAPASSADSIPLPNPPTQKNGIGRYRRVSESMQRAARPDCTAPNALPWEWMTPLGEPLLPEVNMMTSGSLGVTVSVSASTMAAGPFALRERRRAGRSASKLWRQRGQLRFAARSAGHRDSGGHGIPPR